jgi:hypothetical protein
MYKASSVCAFTSRCLVTDPLLPFSRAGDCLTTNFLTEDEVNLRPPVSRPVCLGVVLPSEDYDQIFFLSDNCRFLDVRCPLWQEDGSVIFLYNCFWALPEQSLTGPSPIELTAIFNCLIWDSPNLEGQVPVFISPQNRVVQLYLRTLGSLFVASYDSQGYGGGILTFFHMD